tara:strand:+ start:914 stop:1369 length:456 start_codon:yes stop_codon:yes gene_type:complete
MAFTNDKTATSSFTNDSYINANSNFVAEQYTKYIAQDYTADDTYRYYGSDNDFGLRYVSKDSVLEFSNAKSQPLMTLSKDGVLILNSQLTGDSDIFQINDVNGDAVFKVNSKGLHLGDTIQMNANDELPTFNATHGFTFYDGDAYAKVGSN